MKIYKQSKNAFYMRNGDLVDAYGHIYLYDQLMDLPGLIIFDSSFLCSLGRPTDDFYFNQESIKARMEFIGRLKRSIEEGNNIAISEEVRGEILDGENNLRKIAKKQKRSAGKIDRSYSLRNMGGRVLGDERRKQAVELAEGIRHLALKEARVFKDIPSIEERINDFSNYGDLINCVFPVSEKIRERYGFQKSNLEGHLGNDELIFAKAVIATQEMPGYLVSMDRVHNVLYSAFYGTHTGQGILEREFPDFPAENLHLIFFDRKTMKPYHKMPLVYRNSRITLSA